MKNDIDEHWESFYRSTFIPKDRFENTEDSSTPSMKKFEQMLSNIRKDFKEKMTKDLDKSTKLMLLVSNGSLEDVKNYIEGLEKENELNGMISFLLTFLTVNSKNEKTEYLKSVVNRVNRDNALKKLGVE